MGNMAKLHHNITSQKTCPEWPRVFSASVDLHGNLFTMLCKFLFLIDKHILNTTLILFSCFKIQSQRQSYHRSRRQEERQDNLVLKYATYLMLHTDLVVFDNFSTHNIWINLNHII